jgi:cytochrome c oxidase subunit IV
MSEHAIDQSHGHGAHAHVETHNHPGPAVYGLVAVALVILTAMEIGVFYAPFLQPWLVPLLVILAILKFILVAAFYMHLWYDDTVFTVLFGFPLLLAVLICMSLMMLFLYLGHHLAT